MTNMNTTIKPIPPVVPSEDDIAERAAIAAYLREHPHLTEASPAWQEWYYRVRTAILKDQ